MKRIKVLYCSYACEPLKGSEPGVGWNVPYNMAQQYSSNYEVFLLTKKSKQKAINAFLRNHPVENLHILYYGLPPFVDKLIACFGEQARYVVWELFARSFVKKMDKKIHFDLIHHVTYNQYRTPSPGFFLEKPFVMGPVGGAETIHKVFFQDLSASTIKKEKYRKKGYDLHLFQWLNNFSKNKKVILFSSNENKTRLKPYCGNSQAKVVPAISFDPNDFPEVGKFNADSFIDSDVFEMVYAGRPLDWKGLLFFLKATKKSFIKNKISNFRIKLIGIRNEDEQKIVKEWVSENQLIDNVELIPFIPREQLLKILQTCNLSVYPAFRDSGSMSVLEASALGCPTICFNAGGQDAFPDDILLKIDLTDNYEILLERFSEKMLWAYNNQLENKNIGLHAQKYVYENMTWNNKSKVFDEIYKSII